MAVVNVRLQNRTDIPSLVHQTSLESQQLTWFRAREQEQRKRAFARYEETTKDLLALVKEQIDRASDEAQRTTYLRILEKLKAQQQHFEDLALSSPEPAPAPVPSRIQTVKIERPGRLDVWPDRAAYDRE
jgi:hypothetical protein